MRKQLFFYCLFLMFLALPSFGQTISRHVNDNSTRGVVCPLNLTNNLPDANFQCTVELADLTPPSIVDGCGQTVVPTTDNSVFPITAQGMTTIVWTYDNGTTTGSQTQDINIFDFTEPVPDLAVLPDFNAQCEVQESDLTVPTATDNCGGPVTVTHDGTFPITTQGVTTITWSYKDVTGNTSTQIQDIVLFDFTQPTPDAAVLSDIISPCQLLQADVPVPTATDNCGGAVTVTSDAVYPITANTTITWTYTDANGNSESQLQDVIIFDFTEPTPDVAILPNIFSQCAVQLLDITVPTATDNCGGPVIVTNDAVFPITADTTITWTYTDASGNSLSQLQDVYISDFTEPTPDVAILPDFFASCSVALADLPVPTATDNCGGTVTVTTDAVFPITASTLITWTYTDANGNSASQLQDVYINDFTEPTPDVAILSDIFGSCQVLQSDVPVPTATDNCGGPVVVTSDALFPITSDTLITWTYTDASGNSQSQLQDVYITDFIDPVADTAVLSDFVAQCSVVATDLTIPTATDNCSGVINGTNDGIFPITASTTITWTYTDASGNTTTQTQDIEIDDTTAPTPDAAALADITVQCEVLATDVTDPTATDNCSGVVTVTNDASFPITASTTITWTYTDVSGNSTNQTQNVVVNDTIAPTPDAATLPDITMECEVLATDVTEPSATDNCNGLVTVTNDAVYPITASTTITWTYTDGNGNSATQTQQVIVDDTTDPTPDAALLADIVSPCEVLAIDVTAPTATDNCTGVVTVTSDAVFPITSSTTITWTYTDAKGNFETQTQQVIISDATAPVPDVAVLADFTSQCAVLATDLIEPTATDNCSGVVTVTNDGIFPIAASTTITWTYTDANGNSDIQTQQIIINDNTAPTPDVATLADVLAQCEVLAIDLTEPTATDNCSGIVTVTNDAVFPITSSTTITWTYADANGNSATQTQEVIIDDTTAPTPDVAVLTAVTGSCEVQLLDITAPTATDNCSGIVIVTNDAIFPITATTTITWTYADANGNTSTQTQDVIINDTVAPIGDSVFLSDIVSPCEVLAIDVAEPTATDNCNGLVIVTNDAVFPITASTTITWTYTDANGNSSTQTQQVIISDNIAPTPDAATLADITVECEVLATDVTEPTATDNCNGVITVTNDAVFPITASTTITWTYTDANGNSVTQTQQVVINDTTAPTPDAAILADINGQCEILATDITEPTATDNCVGIVTVTNDAVFPITASTIITWTYADANGNSATQTQEVFINDTTGPTPDVAILADINGQCEVLATDVTEPTATDNCSGVVTITNDAVYPITSSTAITWTYDDGNGNLTSQIQQVVINDTTAPTPDAAILADVTAECEVLATDVTEPTATDNCSGVVTVANDAVFPITASTTITWTFTDANGNSVTQTQQVVINDTTAPTPDAAILADVTAECEVLATDVTEPTATDNCSGVVTVTNNAVFPITLSTTITWTYTDANGNTATQSQNVVISDTQAPTATLTDITVSVDVTGNVSITPDQIENGTAADNCGIASITVTPNAFDCTALGDHIVTVVVTDIHGNTFTDTATVTVNDPVDFCGALGVTKPGKTSFVLYPNPTADVVYINAGNTIELYVVRVYSLTGQLVMEHAYQEKSSLYSLSIGSLAAGTYLLKLETKDGNHIERIVKQ